jgi:hypothetical protein
LSGVFVRFFRAPLVTAMYGESFSVLNHSKPSSFIAEGSSVIRMEKEPTKF